jgi:hypothetical protein
MRTSERNIFSILCIVLVAGLISCTKEDDGPGDNSERGVKSFVTLTINIPNQDEDATRTAEDSGEHEVGYKYEYAVKMAYIYLFRYGIFRQRIDMDFSGVTASSTGDTRTYSKTQDVTGLTPGDYDAYVLVNEAVAVETPSEEDFRDAQFMEWNEENYWEISSTSSPGLQMSGREDDGTLSKKLTISTDNSSSNPASLSFTVERAVAKIQLAAARQKPDSAVNVYEIYWDRTAAEPERIATVQLYTYQLQNLARHGYAFRHVGDYAEEDGSLANTPSFGVISEAGGENPYVIVPDHADYTDPYNTASSSFLDDCFTTFYSRTPDEMITICYAYENAMFRDRQKKGYCTRIMFEAYVFPDSLYCWDAASSSLVIKLKEAADGHEAYDLTTDLAEKHGIYSTIMLYYGGRFYNSVAALQADLSGSFGNLTESSTLEAIHDAGINVLVFVSGVDKLYCYYWYYIKHLDNYDDNELGVMEYSIVRNNVYKLKVTDIYGIGDYYGFEDPDDPVEPYKYYIKVDLEIKPWIVRDNTNIHLGA